MTETVRPQDIHVELEAAVAAENAANVAVAALEDAARRGETVDPSELSMASGAVLLCRLRRQQVTAEVEAAEAEAAETERAAALDELAQRAAADARLNPDVIRNLEAAARAAVQAYADALTEADRAFRDLAEEAAKLGVRIAGRDASDADVLIAGSTWRSGGVVRYGDPARVRVRGVEFAPPPLNLFTRFAGWVAGLD